MCSCGRCAVRRIKDNPEHTFGIRRERRTAHESGGGGGGGGTGTRIICERARVGNFVLLVGGCMFFLPSHLLASLCVVLSHPRCRGPGPGTGSRSGRRGNHDLWVGSQKLWPRNPQMRVGTEFLLIKELFLVFGQTAARTTAAHKYK